MLNPIRLSPLLCPDCAQIERLEAENESAEGESVEGESAEDGSES